MKDLQVIYGIKEAKPFQKEALDRFKENYKTIYTTFMDIGLTEMDIEIVLPLIFAEYSQVNQNLDKIVKRYNNTPPVLNNSSAKATVKLQNIYNFIVSDNNDRDVFWEGVTKRNFVQQILSGGSYKHNLQCPWERINFWASIDIPRPENRARNLSPVKEEQSAKKKTTSKALTIGQKRQ
jgi:hypothetical protein